jgi:hypothetical protein
MAPLPNLEKFPTLEKIENFDDVSGSKFIPYTMIGGCILLAGYALWPSSQKAETEEDEEVEEN